MVEKQKKHKEKNGNDRKQDKNTSLKKIATLVGKKGPTYKMAVSPSGEFLAVPSPNWKITIYDLKNGEMLNELSWNKCMPICVDWSQDEKLIVSGGGYYDSSVHIWDASKNQVIKALDGHYDTVSDVAWSKNNNGIFASCSYDGRIIFWNIENKEIISKTQQKGAYETICWNPKNDLLCSGDRNGFFRIWNYKNAAIINEIKCHTNTVCCVAWSENGKFIASASLDQTICIWTSTEIRHQYVLEGHNEGIVSITFINDDQILASLSENGSVIFWSTDTWDQVLNFEKIASSHYQASIVSSPSLSLIALPNINEKNIDIWSIDPTNLSIINKTKKNIHYVNAKAVILGDSGVGKSGLGIRIAEKEFRPTEGSTHGAQFWHFRNNELNIKSNDIDAELTIWDLAGQPEYRLTHQLFIDDTDAAFLLFDCSDTNDPFRGVHYWAKILKKASSSHVLKFLVSSRVDVSPVTVEENQIKKTLTKYGLHEYFRTSAFTGEGVNELFENLIHSLPWDQLPKTSTPKLFQIVREFLVEQKKANHNIINLEIVYGIIKENSAFKEIKEDGIKTIIKLLQSRGLVYRLEPNKDLSLILLKPELVNQYGASIIQAARNHHLNVGAVKERKILGGDFNITGFNRLQYGEEQIVLKATVEILISHDLCFREMGYLIFPSQINIYRVAKADTFPKSEVTYNFSGSIESIYASLVVRLSYSQYFKKEEQWRYAVEFSRNGKRLGFSMKQIEEGTGAIDIYFSPEINEFDRVTFIRFITDHLHNRSIDIEEQLRLYCPKCKREITDRDAICRRILDGKLDITCQMCDTTVVIPNSVEERYKNDPKLNITQRKISDTVNKRIVDEVLQFRSDHGNMEYKNDSKIRILHISDLHIKSRDQADKFRSQLETDLKQELKIKKLEYLVISGDISKSSIENEYQGAFDLVDSLVKRFGLNSDRVIIVPGNHDINWDLSEESYKFIPKRKLPSRTPENATIPAGETGALIRQDELYRKRFDFFNTHFYRRIYLGRSYTKSYKNQVHIVERPDDKILFVGFNSCWEVDHYFKTRSSINPRSLTSVIDFIQDGTYEDWLKIAVWHHNVIGKDSMNDEFLEQLSVHNFQICLHGHIHQAKEGYFKYDEKRGIRIIGAGTFGAPSKEQVTSIPLQYNLINYDPKINEIVVTTRKKEKPEGSWSADARWGDKNNPVPFYSFKV